MGDAYYQPPVDLLGASKCVTRGGIVCTLGDVIDSNGSLVYGGRCLEDNSSVFRGIGEPAHAGSFQGKLYLE